MTQLEVIQAFIRGEPARMNNLKSTGHELMVGQTVVSTRALSASSFDVVLSCSCGGNPCGMVWNTINRLLRQCHKLDGAPFTPIKFKDNPPMHTAWITVAVHIVNIPTQGVTT
jgi:hypothetical protein